MMGVCFGGGGCVFRCMLLTGTLIAHHLTTTGGAHVSV
jgi:hypothetical protein